MATIQEALDSARQLGVMFKAMATISDKLEELGSLENYEKELRGAVEKAKGEAEASRSRRDAALVEEGEVHQRCKALEESSAFTAKEDADRIISDANAQAVQIVSGAETRLQDVTAAAVALDAQIVDLIAKRDAAAAEKTSIDASLSEARAKVARLMEA